MELALREVRLLALVADHAAVGIEPEALQLSDPPIPEVEPRLVTLELVFGGSVASVRADWP